MINNSSKLLFLSTLILGTMITISANSWISAWMGLEINLLSFIPLMSDNSLTSNEAALKYFLVQTIASAILLFTILMMMYNMNKFLITSSSLILTSLFLKTGIAPFHFWFANVMEGLSWMNNFILMTWQKIAPFMLISYISLNFLIIICSILSASFGALGGLNQMMLRKLMAYSSINHLSWMLSSMMMNEILWIMYFMFYVFLSFNLIFLFNLSKIYYFNQLTSLFYNNKLIKFLVMLNFLSMGGLPPFLGFLPKWLIINELVINNYFLLTFTLILFSLITLFFYMRMAYINYMLNYYEMYYKMKMYLNKFQMNLFLFMSFISTSGLIMFSLVYYNF
nr:NADH dehydrogenase subunit 2 [Phyllomyza sp.]